jgi:RNA recognition motif-containing protein
VGPDVSYSKEKRIALKNLYVGNLSFQVNSSDLEQLFAEFGEVQSAQVVADRETGRSRGFGFVEMVSAADAQAAIDGLHDREYQGRRLTVNEARPRAARVGAGSSDGASRGRSGGYGGRGRSGGYGGGGYGSGGYGGRY